MRYKHLTKKIYLLVNTRASRIDRKGHISLYTVRFCSLPIPRGISSKCTLKRRASVSNESLRLDTQQVVSSTLG